MRTLAMHRPPSVAAFVALACPRFNPAERCLLASTGSSREVCLYDTRATVPMRKVIVSARKHAVANICPLNRTPEIPKTAVPQ